MKIKNEFDHMTNMATMPVYGKIILKNFLLNKWTDCLEI